VAIRNNLGLGLTHWGLGLHTIRDKAGHTVRECRVVRLWAANILPCFYMPARISVAFDGIE
jgi:hypothetical protein